MAEDNILADVAAAAATVAARTPAETPAASAPTPAEPVAPAETTPEAPSQTAERARGADGKFVPKTAETPAKAAEPKPAAAEAPKVTEPAAPPLKAPQSWTAEEREEFAKAPPRVQAAALRREREIATGLQEAAQARRTADAYQQALAPYASTLAVSGPDQVRAVAGIVQTAHALQNAPPAHRAAIIANLVRGYGIPIDALASALDGQPQQAQQQAQPAVDINAAIAQALEQREQQQMVAQARQTAAAFASDPKHEFFADVRNSMAALLQGGLASSVEDAYKKACSLDEKISSILQQRGAAAQAKADQVSTQRLQAAAISVRNEPTAPIGAPGGSDDVLADVRAAAARVRRQ